MRSRLVLAAVLPALRRTVRDRIRRAWRCVSLACPSADDVTASTRLNDTLPSLAGQRRRFVAVGICLVVSGAGDARAPKKQRPRRQLDQSNEEFETGSTTLPSVAPTPDIGDNFQLLEQLFDEFQVIGARPVNLANAKVLAAQNEELIWIATQAAQLIQQQIKSARSDLISIAGEMRTLTQRTAKRYLFRSMGIRSDVIANDLKKAEADFRIAIVQLLKAPQNTAQINGGLALVETQWIFLKQAIERLNANKTSAVELEYVNGVRQYFKGDGAGNEGVRGRKGLIAGIRG